MKPSRALSDLLFLPAMALLAALLFGLFWLVIRAGNGLVALVHGLASAAGLPFPIALTLAVFAAALGVYGLFWALFERR